MNDAAQQQAQRVDQDVALAAVDLLAGIVAARAAAFAGPDRLAVDDAGGRLRLTARGRACQDQQRVVQAEQGAVPPPAAEVAEDGAPEVGSIWAAAATGSRPATDRRWRRAPLGDPFCVVGRAGPAAAATVRSARTRNRSGRLHSAWRHGHTCLGRNRSTWRHLLASYTRQTPQPADFRSTLFRTSSQPARAPMPPPYLLLVRAKPGNSPHDLPDRLPRD